MRHVTITMAPVLLVPDGIEARPIQELFEKALMNVDLGQGPGVLIERIELGRIRELPARESICRVGGHPFYPQDWRTQNLDICSEHAQEEWWDTAIANHRPLFDAITQMTGLVPRISYQGGTATFEISLGGDAGPRFPLYQGLVQHRAISGHWLGTVGYYATEDDDENKDVIDSHVSSPLYPREWAGRLAEHFFALTRPR
ncbi:hypothetical protein LWF15_11210 [Kineosporia rhizophila]|uniref:hypothetical protein n=1 Tax=Kineosporia rhizophila TaxID=84633 RepID=UPI001E35DC69|nr:hypothetical protein [Kineosporia rhizophila]MCE0536079.1 hypothetical protein [Kineosporia rhizophila]